jgi:hypothetical protein
MVHPYAQEVVARVGYAERSRRHLLDALGSGEVQSALGDAALSLLRQANDFYILDVTDTGVISIPDRRMSSDALPLLALRNDERVERDFTFASFTPRQYASARAENANHLEVVAARVVSGEKEAFAAQTFNKPAAVMRMTYSIPDYPPGLETYFNLRPLVLLRYDPDAGKAPASTLANALTQAAQVVENPVLVVGKYEDFKSINEEWMSRGQAVGAIIAALFE